MPRLNFASDNVAGVAPEIMAALQEANRGPVPSYGADEITARLERRFSDLFEHEVSVLPVATGTAANALSLACMTTPWSAIFCSEMAHIALDEANAPEFYTAGAKIIPLPAPNGKLKATSLQHRLPGPLGNVHHAQPALVSLTQSTECGTLYNAAEVAAIGEIAKHHGLKLHMDGARFANAVSALGVSPADITWRAGVDILSFGATKNGAMAAEAVILFDHAQAGELAFRRKRAGHLLSKHRFISAQLEAYVTDDLWLRNGAQANAAAARLAAGLGTLPGAYLRYPVEANEIFIELPVGLIQSLLDAGYQFLLWGEEKDPSQTGTCVRLVTSFDTTLDDVDRFIETGARLSAV